jgi:hypothetical protein
LNMVSFFGDKLTVSITIGANIFFFSHSRLGDVFLIWMSERTPRSGVPLLTIPHSGPPQFLAARYQMHKLSSKRCFIIYYLYCVLFGSRFQWNWTRGKSPSGQFVHSSLLLTRFPSKFLLY